jgi:hypothetical protein
MNINPESVLTANSNVENTILIKIKRNGIRKAAIVASACAIKKRFPLPFRPFKDDGASASFVLVDRRLYVNKLTGGECNNCPINIRNKCPSSPDYIE